MKIKLLYLLIFFTSNSFFLFSQTNVSGGLFVNTTWGVNGSPYIVTGDVALFPGNTLTIEQGVTIKFNSGTKLILRGTLISVASPGNEITFTSNLCNPTKGSWAGIEIENNQGGKIIASNILGEYADNFIRILNSSSGEILNISNSEIKNCNHAFYGYDSHSNHTVVLDSLHVNNNNYGYIYAQNVTLTNSVFSDGEKGIHCWAGSPNMYISDSEFFNFTIWPFNMSGEIDNCYIHHNAVGIRMKSNLLVKNSSIEFNLVGVDVVSPNQVSGENIFNNEICNNTDYNVQHRYSYPVTISNNCWCSNVPSQIAQSIHDGYDDVSLGIVTYSPFLNDCSIPLNMENIDIKNVVKIHPNPATNEINFSEEIEGDYKIYAINGTLVKQGKVSKKLNVTELNTGLYLITVWSKNQTELRTLKFIKK